MPTGIPAPRTGGARTSLDAIAATGAGTVLCGHGEPWHDGAQALVEAAPTAPVA